MAEIRFRVRGTKEDAPIYLRFSDSRICNFEMKSGYTCNPKYFNNKSGKVRDIAEFKNKVNLQNKLNDLENDVRNSFNSTPVFTREWLKIEINRHHGIKPENETRTTLVQFIEKFIKYKEFNSIDEVAQSTIKSYYVTIFRVKNFQTYIGKEYFIDEVGSDFKDAFVEWARSVAKYQPSTFGKTLKQLRTVCLYAKKKKIQVDETLFTYEPTKSRKQKNDVDVFPHLTFAEIDELMKFKGVEHLENARDWLVISCWTGCRVSDLMNLTTDNIVTTITKDKAIRYTQIKTGGTVETALHPHVQKILLNRGGFPRPISHQKYNDYIKDVCKLAEINELFQWSKMDDETKRKKSGTFPKHELITSHIGRRSFATNHYGKFSNHSIMQVTGHSTERQFLQYIGKKDTTHVSDFNKFWNDQKDSTPAKHKPKKTA